MYVHIYIYIYTFWVVVHTWNRSPQEAVTGWSIIWGQLKLFRHEDQTLLASNKKILIWNRANMPTFYTCFSKHDIRGCSLHRYFFHCRDHLPGRSSLRMSVQTYGSWGKGPSCGKGTAAGAVTLHPQSGSREMNATAPLTLIFTQSRARAHRVVPPTVEVGLSTIHLDSPS